MSYPINYHVLSEDFKAKGAGTEPFTQDDAKWLLESLHTMCNAYDKVTDTDPLTAEDLHAAAEKIGVDAEEKDHGVKEDAIYEFVDGSVFDNYPNMDPISLSYGILIGVRAKTDKQGD